MDSNVTPFIPFGIPALNEWSVAAKQELQGADPWETLVVKKGNLTIQPIYNPSTESGNAFSLKASTNIFSGARSWANMPRIEVTNESDANKLAIDYLNSGAEGILFDCKKDKMQFNLLLKDIHLEICPISFLMNSDQVAMASDYGTYASGHKQKESITGAIFWKDMPEDFSQISYLAASTPQFFPFGAIVANHSEADSEIAQALVQAVTFINRGVGKGIAPRQIVNQISFSVAVGTDFFLEIAKLKSLRFLWYQVAGAYSISNPTSLHIHATSTCWKNETYQPHSNMIKSTTAGMAAILGGCDSLTVEPEDSANTMMNRIARNVSSVIRDESHFSKIADATIGSYYLDSLTEQLSEKAWQKFQQLVSE